MALPNPPSDPTASDPTATVDALLALPSETRGAEWRRRFRAAIPDAALTFAREAAIGPDGFPYVAARRAGGTAEGRPLRDVAMALTDAGVGVALEPEGGAAEWVFSLGALAGLRMFGHLEEPPGWSAPAPAREEVEVLQEEESALVGAPTEEYLPLFLRPHLARLLREGGVEAPRAALVLRADGTERLLAFEIGDGAAWDRLGWYLPPGYGWLELDGDTVRELGVPLDAPEAE